ncbi:histidine kinase [uncultured Dokdonia sp.]|uniref:sensor histidine kinase n=1 Tax=uncultured Dokdonia sp. TaxID=575653 RepID=UPI00260EE9E4|nr:histidine kinase [uncultured Dokdonia sp.]
MDSLQSEDFSLILIVGMTGMFALAIAIILFVLIYKRKIIEEQLVHQQGLILTAVAIQEEERKRFAADLHDEIGGGISTILLSISGLENHFQSPIKEKVSIKVEGVRQQLNELLDSVREISYDITPNALETYGLIATLSDLCYQIQESGQLVVLFECKGKEERLDFSKELAIYRICKELLSNTIKHAKASQISLSVLYNMGVFTLSYQDNGSGFIYDASSKGSGMRNMMNRSRILDAILDIKSVETRGMEAYLTLKL